MADPIPEGFLSIREAFEQFRATKWSDQTPRDMFIGKTDHPHGEKAVCLGKIEDVERQEFVNVFAAGKLHALVRFADKPDNFRLLPESWSTQFFAERVLLADEIATSAVGPWQAMAGRIPFVAESSFHAWLGAYLSDEQKRDSISGASLQLARHELIDAVFHGRKAPDEAENLAASWRLRPLESRPVEDRFDPMAEPTWTVAMAAAWIVWRTPEEVRENWDAYRRECWDWHSHHSRLPINGGREWQDVEGWELRQREPATLHRLGLLEAIDHTLGDKDEKLVSVKTAREELWTRLAEGALMAGAVNAENGRPLQIPTHEWAYLVATADKNLADQLRFKDTSLKVEYREVTLSRVDICRFWPPSQPASHAGDPYPFKIELAEIKKGPFLFLGEAIEWIIARDAESDTGLLAKQRDGAERELFAFLDKIDLHGQPPAEGYPAPRAPRVYEPLPSGIWARMNKGSADDPTFSPLDDSEQRENGGSITVGSRRWDGVRLPTSFVLEHWPPIQGIDAAGDQPIRAEKLAKRYPQSELEKLCRKLAQQSPKPSVRKVEELAKVKFHNRVPRDRIRDAWQKANPGGLPTGRRAKIV